MDNITEFEEKKRRKTNILTYLKKEAERPVHSRVEIYKKIINFVGLPCTVLITGETGTGKEIVAQTIYACEANPEFKEKIEKIKVGHSDSALVELDNRRREIIKEGQDQKTNPYPIKYLKVSCAELIDELSTSELFGHTKGAFTGATEDRPGMLAEDAFVFLDEIGEASPILQTRLLTAVQRSSPSIRRLGSNETEEVKARIITATNRDLKTAVSEGKFREDLYYRLAVHTVEVQPLRTRKEEIPIYVGRALLEFSKRYNERDKRIEVKYFDKEIQDLFMQYNWPGSVRELRNEMDRLVVQSQSKDGEITAEMVSKEIREFPTAQSDGTQKKVWNHLRNIPFNGKQLNRDLYQKFLDGALVSLCYSMTPKASRVDIEKMLGLGTGTLNNSQWSQLVAGIKQSHAKSFSRQEYWDECFEIVTKFMPKQRIELKT